MLEMEFDETIENLNNAKYELCESLPFVEKEEVSAEKAEFILESEKPVEPESN